MAAFSPAWNSTYTGSTQYDYLWGYVQPIILQAGPSLSPAALARLHLSRAYRTPTVPTRAALRPRCALLTLAPRRTIVARGLVSWIRQGGRRPLKCRSCPR